MLVLLGIVIGAIIMWSITSLNNADSRDSEKWMNLYFEQKSRAAHLQRQLMELKSLEGKLDDLENQIEGLADDH